MLDGHYQSTRRTNIKSPGCHSIPIPSNPWPMHANPAPIPSLSCACLMPMGCQSEVNFSFQPNLANLSIATNPSQFLSIYANLGHSNANFRPFPRAICPFNLGTSALSGMVPSLLGGRIQDNRASPILTNPCQSWPIHANPVQSMPILDNRVPIPG